MADNTTLNIMTGGDVIATDDIAGVKYQRQKITIGADGVNDGDVSAANPLPVTAAALPLPTGAATAAAQLPDGHNVTIDNGDPIPVYDDSLYNMTEAELQAARSVLDTIAAGQSGLAGQGTLEAVLTALEVIDNAISGSGVNVSQINGVAPTMGNGASGTGVQRVTIASDSTGQVIARGEAAHDAAVAGNPLLNGAEARTTDQTAVASGDITRLQATVTGKQVVLPYALPENSLSGTASATNTSDTAVIAAQGAGVRIYVTSIIISNSSATDTEVVIKSATTARLTFPAPATSGAVHSFAVPLQLTANEALNFASLASVTTMKVSAVGYKGA